MPSIRAMRDQRQGQGFTGREAELELFRALLLGEERRSAILHIYGVGGVGKSSLLREFRRLAEERGLPTAAVDMQVNFGIVELLRALRAQLGAGQREPFAEFDHALDLYNDVKSKLQHAVGSVASGVISGLREGVPLGLGALAVDAIGEEQVKAWLYRHLPRANADLYLQGDRILTEKLVAGLNTLLAARRGRALCLIDTYEQSSQAQDDWLRDCFLDSELSSELLIVIAGRDPLGGRWSEWKNVLTSRELRPFSEEEARSYLERRGITSPAAVQGILSFTARLPWALAIVADTPGAAELDGAEFNPHAVGNQLVDRFISQLQGDAEMLELVDACAVVRTFDYDVVRALWGREAVDEPLRRLRRFSFVTVRPDGRWSLHQVVREFLDQGLHRRSPARWLELSRRAASFHEARANSSAPYSPDWNWSTLESLYHRLRLDEAQGMSRFASLFEDAKHYCRIDFCSELLNNVLDVPGRAPETESWLTFYRSVLEGMASPFAWARTQPVLRSLYQRPGLPPALRARVTTDLGRFYYMIAGEPAPAIAVLEESLTIRRELGDVQGQAHVLSHLAVARAAAGDTAGARVSALESVHVAEELGVAYRLGWSYFSLGQVETSCGDLPSAEEHLARAAAIFARAGHEYEDGVVAYHLGRAALARGDRARAIALLRRNLGLMQRYGREALAARAQIDLAEILVRGGDDPARELADAAALLARQANPPLRARLFLLQAELALAALPRPLAVEESVCRGEALAEPLAHALLAAAEAPPATLAATVERIGDLLAAIAERHALLGGVARRSLLAAVASAPLTPELRARLDELKLEERLIR